jgi:DNA (cytosine-5)-methyltransferase 1
MNMTLGSLFDGIAGFPLAAKRQGIKTIWASEILKDCVDVAKKHFPDAEHLGDVEKLNGAELRPVDIISFGSPCQNLSIAGNRKGLEGSASSLFFEAVRIIDEMRCATDGKYPKYAVWENVAGAFSSNKGRDFQRVLEEIAKTEIPMPNSGRWAAAGMVRSGRGSTAWRTMDAQYWGVPQRRKRIYLVHDFAGGNAGKILFERESVLGNTAESEAEGKRAAERAKNSIVGTDSRGMDPDGKIENCLTPWDCQSKRVFDSLGVAPTLQAAASSGRYDAAVMLPVYTIAGNVIGRTGKNGGNQLGIGEDTSPTLAKGDRHVVCYPEGAANLFRSGSFSGFQEDSTCGMLTKGQAKIRGGTSVIVQESNSYRLNGYGEYKEGVGPLRASGGNNGGGSENLITTARKAKRTMRHIVRRLTPLECERLDGFPDNWTKYGASGKEMSDNMRYMTTGNSIAVPCAERVFMGIIAAEQEEKDCE